MMSFMSQSEHGLESAEEPEQLLESSFISVLWCIMGRGRNHFIPVVLIEQL